MVTEMKAFQEDGFIQQFKVKLTFNELSAKDFYSHFFEDIRGGRDG